MTKTEYRGKPKYPIESSGENGWVYGYYWQAPSGKSYIKSWDKIGWMEVEVIPETVGSFVHEDFEQRKAFSGDIYKCDDTKYELRWSEGMLSWDAWQLDNPQVSRPCNVHYLLRNGKYLGNKHDNPDLLTQT